MEEVFTKLQTPLVVGLCDLYTKMVDERTKEIKDFEKMLKQTPLNESLAYYWSVDGELKSILWCPVRKRLIYEAEGVDSKPIMETKAGIRLEVYEKMPHFVEKLNEFLKEKL